MLILLTISSLILDMYNFFPRLVFHVKEVENECDAENRRTQCISLRVF